MDNNTILIAGVAAGFVVVPLLAGAAPTAVNGVLILILVGIVLMRSSSWLGWLSEFTSAFSGPRAGQHGKFKGHPGN